MVVVVNGGEFLNEKNLLVLEFAERFEVGISEIEMNLKVHQ